MQHHFIVLTNLTIAVSQIKYIDYSERKIIFIDNTALEVPKNELCELDKQIIKLTTNTLSIVVCK